jgi:phenylpropionate dioxygenase-like ring-hydroxylating dioxygenase large terminal subunit
MDSGTAMRVPADHWYPLVESREVRRKPVTLERLGMKLVFWRSSGGAIHAQLDRCPHLGASLGAGRVEGDHIVCPFHGFCYDGEGRCVHIPAVGKSGKIPRGLAVQSFAVREAHGFVWLWLGAAGNAAAQLPWFRQLDSAWHHHTIAVDWPVHYTRAIENQLDVAHLPFVHRTTIGRGGRSLVEGPYVEANETGIRVWPTNRRDDGPVRDMTELAAAAADREPGLEFLYPGIWLLNIGPRFKNFIAFVPINERTTRYYLRVYHKIGPRLLARPLGWMMSQSNRFILNQDRRVVVKQTPASSEDAGQDRLVGADRAINDYRKQLARSLE